MAGSQRLRIRAIILLALFGLQFLLGMTLNLFINLPANHPGTTQTNYLTRSWHGLGWALSFSGGAALAIHVYVGLGLMIGCIALTIDAVISKNRLWSYIGGLATLFTIGALANGLGFIDYNHNFSSMIMATCWLVSVGVLTFGLLKTMSSPSSKRKPA